MQLPLRLAAAALPFLALTACEERPASGNAEVTVARLHGEGRPGQSCKAQSECGFRQRCVHRAPDILSSDAAVEAGLCEAIVYPGGCYAVLPQHRRSLAEEATEIRAGRRGLPVQVICE